MVCAPLAWILLAAAAARAGIVSRLVPAGAFVFFVVDMLPLPGAEELQGVVGIATFGALAWSLLRVGEPSRPAAVPATAT
jgi:anti-sigma factor RsiW